MSGAGKGVTREDVAELKRLLERHARLFGDFPLSSGLKSNYYFDGKRVTLSSQGATLVGQVLEPIVREAGVEAVGGLEAGAVPIAVAISMQSYRSGTPIPAFFVRDEKKGHGTGEKVAASYPTDEASEDSEIAHRELIREGRRVAIVDDVVTTGDSIQRAIDAVQARGCEVMAVVALVTRPEGNAAEKLGSEHDYISLFNCDKDGNLSLTARAEQLISSPVG